MASQLANHFWDNCDTLWQSDSPNFFGTANHFWPIANHFSNGLAKTFFGPHPIFKQNFPSFRQILCIECKNANYFAIACRYCDATTKKWRITFSFLNPTLVIIVL